MKRVESPLRMVNDSRFLERALIVLVDIAGVVVLRDVEHLFPISLRFFSVEMSTWILDFNKNKNIALYQI